MLNPDPDIQERLKEIMLEVVPKNKISSFFGRDANIKLTSDIIRSKYFQTKKETKTFTTSKFGLIVGAIVLCIFWRLLFSDQFPSNGVIVFLPFLFMLTVGLIYKYFYNEKLNFKISVSTEGIQVDDRFFDWTEIKATAIASYPLGRGSEYIFIVLLNDNYYWEYALDNFGDDIHKSLSKYIEFYKAKNIAVVDRTDG